MKPIQLTIAVAQRCVAAMTEQRLCVKELAGSLGVSVRYVYAMRACGFGMEGTPHNQTTTTKEAVRWIEQNDFKMVDGVGRVAKNKNLTPQAACDTVAA